MSRLNPPGLIRIETGGSANTTSVTIDGRRVMAKSAKIEISPERGENLITLEVFSQQKNKYYEDGETQKFFGISEENFEFMKGLMHYLSQISDDQIERELSMWEIPSVQAFWAFISNERKRPAP